MASFELRSVFVVLAGLLLASGCGSLGKRRPERPVYVPGEVLVGLEREAEAELIDFNDKLGAKVTDRSPELHAVRIALPPDLVVEEALMLYREQKWVAYAEPNYWRWVHQGPNDPAYLRQWAVKRIACEDAWSNEQGDPDVVIAIIDSGVDDDHPDLEGALLEGHSVLGGDPTVDNLGHGTEMAIIAAARRNNELGTAGVAPQCSILPVKAIDDDGGGTDWDFGNAMVWARDNGAHVLNMSFGAAPYSFFLQGAVVMVAGDGRIMISSGGNEGVEAGDYPAAFPEVLAVSGVHQDDGRWEDANYGDDWADVAAPAIGVSSTNTDGLELGNMGTSQAAALTSGAAALLYSKLGTNTSSATIRSRLEDTADSVAGSGWVAHGRIDVYDALENASLPHHETYMPAEVEVMRGDWVEGSLQSLAIRDNERYAVRSVSDGDSRGLWIEFEVKADYAGELLQLDVGWEGKFTLTGGFSDASLFDLLIWDFEADAWHDFGTIALWQDFDSAGSHGATVDPERYLGADGEVRVRCGRTWTTSLSTVHELELDQLRVTTKAQKP